MSGSTACKPFPGGISASRERGRVPQRALPGGAVCRADSSRPGGLGPRNSCSRWEGMRRLRGGEGSGPKEQHKSVQVHHTCSQMTQGILSHEPGHRFNSKGGTWLISPMWPDDMATSSFRLSQQMFLEHLLRVRPQEYGRKQVGEKDNP